MNFLNSETIYYNSSFRRIVPTTLLAFLRSLNGLTVIDISGKNNKKCRVVTTLIHGNEPSGLIACHQWLKSDHIPATNIRIIICNPEAAKTQPFFTNRYVEHSDDLNRFFSTSSENQSPVAIRAHKIISLVKEVSPEAIVDLHNTSGTSPSFSVSTSEQEQYLRLAQLFTTSLILTQISVGAIMEQSFACPIVTIECGGANENAAHRLAYDGLCHFFNQTALFDEQVTHIKIYRHPMRVELIGDASVGFSQHKLPTTDMTLRSDIEELNRELTPKSEFIGWCEADEPFPFTVFDHNGIDRAEMFFEKRNNCLFTRKEMQLFMITTIPEIATKDCLFYVTLT